MISQEKLPTYDEWRLNSKISALLIEMGGNTELNGFTFVVEGVKYILERPTQKISLVFGVYPHIANVCQTTPSRVERNLRHFLQTMWNREKVQAINKAFGMQLFHPNEIPTVGQFLFIFAERVRREVYVLADGRYLFQWCESE